MPQAKSAWTRHRYAVLHLPSLSMGSALRNVGRDADNFHKRAIMSPHVL